MKAAPRLLALAAALAWTAPGPAQEQARHRIATVGLGGAIAPDYPGARRSSPYPWPIFGLRWSDSDLPVPIDDEGGSFPLLRVGDLALGPSFYLQGERRDADLGIPLGDVGRSFELGVGASLRLSRDLMLQADIRKGLGGHGGIVGNVGLDAFVQPSPRLRLSLGPRMRLGDDRFMRAYFAVTPEQAARTGLPVHEARGGIRAIGAALGARHQLGGPWSLHAFGRYDRLVGDAAASPITRGFGARDQWSGGLGLSYSFRIGGR